MRRPLCSLSARPSPVYGRLPRLSCGLHSSHRFVLALPIKVDKGINHKKYRAQFVGGDTAHACLPLIRRLRAENKGTLLAYSVEVDENGAADNARSTVEPLHKHTVQEMIRAIDVTADFEDSQARETITSGRRTWIAVKLVSFIYHWSDLN